MFPVIKEIISYQKDKYLTTKQSLEYCQKKVNWSNPKTYNDFLHLAMIDPKSDKLWIYADKLEVRKYVAQKVGKEILNKVYKVYGSTKEIHFDALPEKFALKTNHGSSQNIICNNKDKLNWHVAKSQLNEWMSQNYYELFRERSYKLIKPKIFWEKYLEDDQGELLDYKFFCWYGQVKFIQVNTDRYTKDHRQTFFDLNWQKLPFYRLTPASNKKINPPSKLNQMLKIASKLSNNKDFAHVRIDLYQVNDKIYFGEMTFTPGAGLYEFTPYKYEYELGKYF